MRELLSLTVFCGSASGRRELYGDLARLLGASLARHQIRLVYGGSDSGVMGILADAVLKEGGEAVGVIPKHLVDRHVHHKDLSELHVVDSMHTRKALMADLGDGFMALPGGFGTLDEFCEIVTWAQLGLHQKPMGLLNPNGFWDGFIRFYEHSAREGFIDKDQTEAILHSNDPHSLLDSMKRWKGMPPKKSVG